MVALTGGFETHGKPQGEKNRHDNRYRADELMMDIHD
jgi:hypothetical protein